MRYILWGARRGGRRRGWWLIPEGWRSKAGSAGEKRRGDSGLQALPNHCPEVRAPGRGRLPAPWSERDTAVCAVIMGIIRLVGTLLSIWCRVALLVSGLSG